MKPQLNTQSGSSAPPPAQAVAHSPPVVEQVITHVGKSVTETWLVVLKRDFLEWSSARATAAKSMTASVTILTEAVHLIPMIDRWLIYLVCLFVCFLLDVYEKLCWFFENLNGEQMRCVKVSIYGWRGRGKEFVSAVYSHALGIVQICALVRKRFCSQRDQNTREMRKEWLLFSVICL